MNSIIFQLQIILTSTGTEHSILTKGTVAKQKKNSVIFPSQIILTRDGQCALKARHKFKGTVVKQLKKTVNVRYPSQIILTRDGQCALRVRHNIKGQSHNN
jgi:hypothetical protein